MLDITTHYVRQILGSLAIIAITICLGSQANGQSTTAELEKLRKKMEVAIDAPVEAKSKPKRAKRKPAKASRTPAKAAPTVTRTGKLKVPKFGVEAPKKTPIPTFAAPTETIEYSEEVKSKAQSTLERYDRDKNRFLDEVELASGRWNPSPLTSDKNGDGRLSLAELQDRYHLRNIEKQKRREAYMERRERRGDGDRGGEGGDRGRGEMSGRGRQAYSSSWRETSNHRTNGRQEVSSSDSDRSRSSSKSLDQARSSYESIRQSSGSRFSRSRTSSSRPSTNKSRTSKSRSSVRTSSAFTKLDANKDQLVQMHEFSSDWPKKKLDEFISKDTNGDGVISPEEW